MQVAFVACPQCQSVLPVDGTPESRSILPNHIFKGDVRLGPPSCLGSNQSVVEARTTVALTAIQDLMDEIEIHGYEVHRFQVGARALSDLFLRRKEYSGVDSLFGMRFEIPGPEIINHSEYRLLDSSGEVLGWGRV